LRLLTRPTPEFAALVCKGKKMQVFQAMYFPYASVRNMSTLKSSLLYFDKIWVISSESAMYHMTSEFAELLKEGELVGWISGEQLVETSCELLNQAIETDLQDPEFLSLTARPQSTWDLYEDKGVILVSGVVQPIRSRGPIVEVPYDRGESFLLNMTVLALTKGLREKGALSAVPLTDDEEHLTVLHHKLRRGATGQLERLYGETLERATKEQLISSIGREALQTVLPDPEDIENIPLERIVAFRREHERERQQLRDAISNAIAQILEEEPLASRAHLRERTETLLNVHVRQLEHEASWTTRILGGFRTLLEVPKAAVRAFNVFSSGAPLELAVAGGTAEASMPILDYFDKQRDLFRTSDVTYLYKAAREFRRR
jgi:hypothetical protein